MLRRSVLSLSFASMLLSLPVAGQTSASFVTDINTNKATAFTPSYPNPARATRVESGRRWVRAGGWFFFTARTDAGGYELYKSDGVKALLVKDIEPGLGSSSPTEISAMGSGVFFTAWQAKTGRELWYSDGSAAGTRLVKEIRAGSMSPGIRNLAVVGSRIVFSADDAVNGSELWVSDGTAANTKLLKDIRPGFQGSSIGEARSTLDGKTVFFRANDGTNGHELFATDGTTAGTRIVKDIFLGRLDSNPGAFQRLGSNKIVFTAEDKKIGRELWVSDGTVQGTTLLLDVDKGRGSGTETWYGASLGNKVLFRGRTPALGYEPWITDGTTAGTFLLRDIVPGAGSSMISFAVSDGGKVYWGASSGKGWGIWSSDGTKAGTSLFSPADISRASPLYLEVVSGSVMFMGKEISSGTGWEISITDGKTAHTVLDVRKGLLSGNAWYCSLIAPGTVAFRANDGTGDELWISKGTAATTTRIDINRPVGPTPTEDDGVAYVESLFGKLLFQATNGQDTSKGGVGNELWISDGTAAGTRLLKDIYPGGNYSSQAYSSFPAYLCRLGNRVFFSATHSRNDPELWSSDGTAAGTTRLVDIMKGSRGSRPTDLTRIGDRIYFAANDGKSGIELWSTDGSVQGTKLVKDIETGTRSSYPTGFARLGHTRSFLFRAFSAAAGQELWISDGTSAGTRLVKDIVAGTSSSIPAHLTSYKGKVYFEAYTAGQGRELWVSDGTAAGTGLVKDSLTGPGSGYARYLCVQDGRLWFSSYQSTTGFEIHVSDGTYSGTSLYWDRFPGVYSTNATALTAVGSRRLYLAGDHMSATVDYGVEPMFLDVTQKTSHIFQLNPLAGGSSFPFNKRAGRMQFAVDHAGVYFAARSSNFRDLRLARIFNGGTAHPIGRVSDGTVLTATDPLLGSNIKIVGATSAKNPLSVLLLGVPLSRPADLKPLVPGSFAYFDLSQFALILGNLPGKAWGTVLAIPNQPSLLGLPAVLQTFALDVLAWPAKTQVSNGIHITIGR